VLDAVEEVLADVKLTTLAFAIAIGWSIYQVAYGVGQLVDGLLTHLSSDGSGFGPTGALTWVVGHHIVSLDTLLVGVLELTTALVVAAFVRRRYASAQSDLDDVPPVDE
jgi:hypothetical protein